MLEFNYVLYNENEDCFYTKVNVGDEWELAAGNDSSMIRGIDFSYGFKAESSSDGGKVVYTRIINSTEQDPNGIGQHDNGAKLDAGKPMAGRLLGMFGGALMAVSEVGTFGAKKYTEGGWQHVEDGFKRYDDGGMRHFLKRGMGEEFDADSELPNRISSATAILG